jgi:hypothetical protein
MPVRRLGRWRIDHIGRARRRCGVDGPRRRHAAVVPVQPLPRVSPPRGDPSPQGEQSQRAQQLAAGTNPKIVSEVLGHKEVAITLDRYSHALPTLQAKAMARLDTVLGRAPRRWPARTPRAAATGEPGPHKGPDKGPNRGAAGTKRPDPSVDRAENDEMGTAYRNRGEPPVESD